MEDFGIILDSLDHSPRILKELIASIPDDVLTMKRIPGKWTIHEHACHIVAVQPMLIKRFQLFLKEEKPVIKPYIPGITDPDDDLGDRDMPVELSRFVTLRAELINIARQFPGDLWQKKAIHPEYSEYTPYILLRHILMHDHFHMYRIEELWLTTDKFLPVS